MLHSVLPSPSLDQRPVPPEHVHLVDRKRGQVTPTILIIALSVATILGVIAVLITD